MIYNYRQIQGMGKTALMVATVINLLTQFSYEPWEVICNFMLRIPGVHCVDNATMKKYLQLMVKKGYQHKIIAITEIDRIFPARFWQKPEQTDALLGLWQDEKLFNRILWDAHVGSSVDLLLRETAQVELIPHYERSMDAIIFGVINSVYMDAHWEICERVMERVFPLYDRWEIIGKDQAETSIKELERTPGEVAVSGQTDQGPQGGVANPSVATIPLFAPQPPLLSI